MYCKNCRKDFNDESRVCPDCGKKSMQDKTPAKKFDYEQLVDDLSQNIFPPHIAELDLPNRTKRAFTCFETLPITRYYSLSPFIEKAQAPRLYAMPYMARINIFRYLTPIVWWTLLFGPLYYMADGMWRKGIVLMAGLLAVGFSVDIAYIFLLNGQFMPFRPLDMFPLLSFLEGIHTIMLGHSVPSRSGIPMGIACIQSMMATYDLYRHVVKKEKFWW